MRIGAAYYPEHWEKERWERDANLMQEFGIDTVRLGEFGWSIMEKEEGRYDFSLYEEAVKVLERHQIKVIMGTPTAAPPKWLCDKFPDIYMRDRAGQKRGFGTRRHYCYNNPEYRRYSLQIVRRQAEHFGDHPGIIAWQIDNELGCEDEVRCYCENCRKSFIEWLKEKYSSIGEVNRQWGTVFWSQTYTDWEQIILPGLSVIDAYSRYTHNPGLLYDFALFSSDSLIDFAREQTTLIRLLTRKPVVHNIVSEYCDNYKLSKLFDRAGYDAYPRSEWDTNSPGRIGFHYSITRGYKEAPFWVLEQQSGPCGWNIMGDTPKPGELALWSIQAAAYGAEALVYFRWRSCLFGAEQFWYGILNHDGRTGKRYEELKKAVKEIKENEEIFALPEKKQVFLVYDYHNKFCHEIQRHYHDFDYKEEVIHYFEALKRLHFQTAVGSMEHRIEEYPVVMLPFCSVIDRSALNKLEEYVAEGGVLVLSAFSGLREENNQITEKILPGVFRELAGIEINEFISFKEGSLELGVFGKAVRWCEDLEKISAKEICIYESGIYGGKTAITVNTFGKGRVYYIGCILEDYVQAWKQIMSFEKFSLLPIPETVEYICKTDNKREYDIFLNHSAEDAVCGIKEKSITIPGYECSVCI